MTRNYVIEPLEARIAPAIINPIFDITAAPGSSGATIDLGKMIDGSSYRTKVELVTNFIPAGQTEPGIITIELFDEKAPLTVANFLRYVNNADATQDYDGLIFHRLVKGFVLQGGGFDTNFFTSQDSHIDTFEPVHNEYNPNDPERSNIIQTVAMAKVGPDDGGGPNSATSEFFINLADNSENLDAQNGGFTVFGRVTDDSMSIINAIAGLQLAGSTPVQNYSGGVPVASQLIQIVDARVVAPVAGDAMDHSFKIASITDLNGAPTKLVTGKITGDDQLKLKFASGKAGVAKVTITANDGSGAVSDDFLVTVKPNLIAEVTDDGLASVFVAGDKGTAKIKLSNTGGGTAKGKINLRLFLSDSTGEANGYALDASDMLLVPLSDISIKLKAGKSTTIPVKFTVPGFAELGDDLTDGKKYRLLVKIESTEEVQELFDDDNVGSAHSGDDPSVLSTYDLAFGAVGGRKDVSLTVPNAQGDDITFSLKGVGIGTVTKEENGSLVINVTGTDAFSSLSVSTERGIIGEINDLFIQNTIGQVKFSNVDLLGHFTASGGAKSIAFGDLGSSTGPTAGLDKTLSIGVFPIETQKLSLKAGEVRDYSLLSSMPVGSLSAETWLNTAGSADNQIFASGLGNLKIAGDLEASVVVASAAKVNQINVGGALRNANVQALGDIGTMKFGSIDSSNIFAGLEEKPISASDFLLEATIANFTVKGTVTDSVIAAARFNSIVIGGVNDGPGTEGYGFYADAIKSYLRKGTDGTKLKNLDDTDLTDALPTQRDVIPGANYALNLF